MTRVAKRAGRTSASPQNVFQNAAGRRVVGPTSAQIGAGRASPAFYAANERQSNVDRAKASGTFDQTRFDFNKANAGKQEMDDAGNIRPVSKAAPELEYGTGGGFRVKKPTAEASPNASNQTPSSAPTPSNGTSVSLDLFKRPTPRPPLTSAANPTSPAKRTEGLIDGKPASQFFQEAANRQGRSNSYGKVQPQAKPAVVPAPTPADKATMGKPSTSLAAGPVNSGSDRDFNKWTENQSVPTPKTTPAASATVTKPATSNPVPALAAKTAAPASKPAPTLPSPELLAKQKAEADLAAQNRQPLSQKIVPAIKQVGSDIAAAAQTVNAGVPKIADGIANTAKDVSKTLTGAVNRVTAPAREFVQGNPIPSAAETTYLQNVQKVAAKKRGPTVFNVPPNAINQKAMGEDPMRTAKIVSRMNGGTINPFKCGGKMKHKMGGGSVPHKVQSYAKGGNIEAPSEVTMVGEEGPELIFNRKDGTQFVTPADVTAQIVDGLEMDDSHEGKEAMAAAKKRIKTKVRHKLFGGSMKPVTPSMIPKPLGGVTNVGLGVNAEGRILPGQSDALGQMDSGQRLQQQGLAGNPMQAQEYQTRLASANAETQMNAGMGMAPNPFKRPGSY
jgi:hypothetical protein